MSITCFLLSSLLTLVELNCENLFDCRHDSLKQDIEFTPDGSRHWNTYRYWKKLNNTAQTILSCDEKLPDLVALCEVENDTVLHDLTRRSLLRNAGYEYLMTQSPDLRGLDVALLYQPVSFHPLCYECITVPTLKGMRPTRDILYVQGRVAQADTLHLFIVHSPSRNGGEKASRPFRMQVVQVLDSLLRPLQNKLVAVVGDFNDYYDSKPLQRLGHNKMVNATQYAKGRQGNARGTYRYHGNWHSLDHLFLSSSLFKCLLQTYINDATFLLEDDTRYGGFHPRRTFNGLRYQPGFSDHLPLVAKFEIK